MPGTNSDIINNNDDKLKHNKLYNTRHTMMNDFTRNSIFKRTACLDNFGINCGSSSSGSTATNGISCSDPHSNTCNGSYTYSENITSAPIFADKYYKPYPTSITTYDINPDNLTIENLSPDTYYNAVKFYQGTVNNTAITVGIRGPVEFILSNPSNDPLNTVYYWAIDDETTYTEFTDKQKQGEHRFVRLAIHQANYKRGFFTVKAYAITDGKKRSGITEHRFNIINYSSITRKPNAGVTCREYIEYLANWFDVNPANSFILFTPLGETLNRGGNRNIGDDGGMGGDGGMGDGGNQNQPQEIDFTKLAYNGMEINIVDQLLLSNYILWLKSYAYDGATSTNRNKLTLADTTNTLIASLSKTYAYGTSSTNQMLKGAKLDDIISTNKRGWLSTSLPISLVNSIVGQSYTETKVPQLRITKDYDINQICFRMNGDYLEYKTNGISKLHKAVFVITIPQQELYKGSTVETNLQIVNIGKFTRSRLNVSTGSNASFEITSVDDINGEPSIEWSKIIRLGNSEETGRPQWKVYKIHSIHSVHLKINTVDIYYDLNVPRPTDKIKLRWIMTGQQQGNWIPLTGFSNAEEEDNYTIQQEGVLNVNYGIQYIDDKGKKYRNEIPPNVNIISSEQTLFRETIYTVDFDLVCYSPPQARSQVVGGGFFGDVEQYGLRGIGIDRFRVPPGINSAKDLLGWKIQRTLYNIKSKDKKTVFYRIGGTFNNNYVDFEYLYISFGTIRDNVSTDPSFQSHYTTYENIDYGYWVPDELLPSDWVTSETNLLSPYEEFPPTSDAHNAYDMPFRYSPDLRSIICQDGGIAYGNNEDYAYAPVRLNGLSGSDFLGGGWSKVTILTDEYIKNVIGQTVDQKTLLPDTERNFPISSVLGPPPS